MLIAMIVVIVITSLISISIYYKLGLDFTETILLLVAIFCSSMAWKGIREIVTGDYKDTPRCVIVEQKKYCRD